MGGSSLPCRGPVAHPMRALRSFSIVERSDVNNSSSAISFTFAHGLKSSRVLFDFTATSGVIAPRCDAT
jgi:hypothetical protein